MMSNGPSCLPATDRRSPRRAARRWSRSVGSTCVIDDVDERRLFSTTPSTRGAMTLGQSCRPWDAWSSAGGRKPRKLRVTVSQALEGRATVTSTTGPVGPQSDPDSSDDPFASPAPWAGLHETWADLSASDDGRERALALGALHGQVVESLLELGAQNGGGLRGIVIGVFERLESLGTISASDRTRLEALMELLRANQTSSVADQQSALLQLQATHEELVSDPTVSPFVLGCSSVALDSVTRALSKDDLTPVTGFATAWVDMAGAAIGGTGGPLGSLAVGTGLSMLAIQVAISY